MHILHFAGFVKRMVPSTSPPPTTKPLGINDKPYSCPICQKRFLTKEYIKHHVDRVHKDDVECSVCHQYFKHTSLLEEHISTAHKNYSNGGGQESLTHDVNIKSEVMDAEHAQVIRDLKG